MSYVRTGGGYKCRYCDLKSKQLSEFKSTINSEQEKINKLTSENQRLVSELESTLKEKEKLEEKIKSLYEDKTEEEDILKKIEELSKML